MKHIAMMVILTPALLALGACAHSPKSPTMSTTTPEQNQASEAIHKMAGCYLVDYNYAETDSLKKGYERDKRVYDVNKVKSVKEWIYAEDISPRQIRLQHILFATGADGKLVADSQLKHQAEDWELSAPYLYEFTGPSQWKSVPLPAAPATWTRRITNLDDGLRYQCASAWKLDGAYPEWTCDNYAPIPGRETRDMKRKDYNTLQRSTRIIVYEQSWLERQNNTKTIHKNAVRTPLASEIGKNWYVRLPDSDCAEARTFADSRKEFWALLRETWVEVLNGQGPFVEKTPAGQPPRYAKMMQIENDFLKQDLQRSEVRTKAREEILKVIAEYRNSTTTQAAK
jgi:hypothetical protein